MFSKARPYTMWELMTKDNKVEAKKLVSEYDYYKKHLPNLPASLSKDLQKIKPLRETSKCILNHLRLQQWGHEKAMEVMW